MTRIEIATMIGSVGVPFAYYQFPNDTPQEPPFICFYYPNSANVSADNMPYAFKDELIIELYTNEKDFDMESTLETILINHGLNYAKTETYLDSERMQMEVYTMEVFING